MPNTYEFIQKQTLSSSQSSVTFSSLSQTYTDLVIYTKHAPQSGQNMALGIRLNSDTGTNYGYNGIYGSTSVAGFAGMSVNGTYILCEPVQGWGDSAIFGSNVLTFPNYANTSRFKNVLIDAKLNAYDSTTPAFKHGINMLVGGWSNTSAITSITLFNVFGGSNINTGSEFTLFGITKA